MKKEIKREEMYVEVVKKAEENYTRITLDELRRLELRRELDSEWESFYYEGYRFYTTIPYTKVTYREGWFGDEYASRLINDYKAVCICHSLELYFYRDDMSDVINERIIKQAKETREEILKKIKINK